MWSEIEAEELSEHSPTRNPFCSSLFRPGSQGALLTAWRSSIDCRSCRQFHRLRQTRGPFQKPSGGGANGGARERALHHEQARHYRSNEEGSIHNDDQKGWATRPLSPSFRHQSAAKRDYTLVSRILCISSQHLTTCFFR